MRGALWSPDSMADVLRQGRERGPSPRDRFDRFLGLDMLRSRKVRRRIRRWTPYAVIGGVALGAFVVALVTTL